MKINRIIILVLFALISCKTNNTNSAKLIPVATTVILDSAKVTYTIGMVDNKRDFACGMPVTAGIEDTCHYKNKVYGFCSKECKEEFLKKPESYLTAK
jgi:YHS domain-containing protein